MSTQIKFNILASSPGWWNCQKHGETPQRCRCGAATALVSSTRVKRQFKGKITVKEGDGANPEDLLFSFMMKLRNEGDLAGATRFTIKMEVLS